MRFLSSTFVFCFVEYGIFNSLRNLESVAGVRPADGTFNVHFWDPGFAGVSNGKVHNLDIINGDR